MREKRLKNVIAHICTVAVLCAGTALAADPGITVSAKPRYPWNGLVDINFTITGDAGTKYATSFTAKDMVGNTNIAMRTIRKADGTVANVANEQLLPGTYSWVWDTVADLTVDRVTHNGFLTTSSTTLFANRSLNAVKDFSIVFGGASITIGEMTNAKAYNIKTDGNGKSIQFQVINGGYLKCVCVHLEQSGNDIVGYVKWARYMAETFPLGTDFDTASYTQYTIATSNTGSGYGVSSMTITCPNSNPRPRFDRVRVIGTVNKNNPLYMVIDLSGGANATSYPISYLDDVPSGGWSDTYKTTKLVLRRIEAGTFIMGSDQSNESHRVTLTKPFYIGIFEMTQRQYELVTGVNPCSSTTYGKGDTYPVHYMKYATIRGSSNGSQWPSSSAVDSSSFMGKLRIRTGQDFDLPTEAQWEYACRAGTTTTYSHGNAANENYMWYNRSNGQSHPVGTKKANPWGLYDMHGNLWEFCLDHKGTLSYGTDPKGTSQGSYIMRGGCAYNGASFCTSFYRGDAYIPYPSHGNYGEGFGFRLCLTLSN